MVMMTEDTVNKDTVMMIVYAVAVWEVPASLVDTILVMMEMEGMAGLQAMGDTEVIGTKEMAKDMDTGMATGMATEMDIGNMVANTSKCLYKDFVSLSQLIRFTIWHLHSPSLVI